jgi:hypothetical protein
MAVCGVMLFGVSCSNDNLSVDDSTQAGLLSDTENNEEPATDCKWEQVTQGTPSNEQKDRLDGVFSGENKLMKSIKVDTLIIINSEEDLIKIQGFVEFSDIWLGFDWDTHSIIGGKISTSSISDEIISRQLLECLSTASFSYEIDVKKCTECWTAIGQHYFWAIYARKFNTENILLTIKTVE